MQMPLRDPPISYDKVVNRRKYCSIHFHSQHELYYLVSGETKYLVGDEIFRLEPGDFIMVPRGVLHQADSETCLHNERILLSFEDEIFDPVTRPYLEELCACKQIRIPANTRPAAEELLRKLQNESERPDPFQPALSRLYILELVTLLCRLRCDCAPKEESGIIRAVLEYIRENYSQDLSLKTLSRQFAISESCLSRKFKAAAGVGISEYITNVRIHHAAQLLTGSDLSVTEVASRCGYNDSNYFSAVFKKVKGTTPLKYSRSNI